MYNFSFQQKAMMNVEGFFNVTANTAVAISNGECWW
jgi:hypothetical protein